VSEERGVPQCREEDRTPGRGEEGREESPGFSRRPGEAVHPWMCGETDELVTDRPGEEPGRGVASPLFEKSPAGVVGLGISINGIDEDIRVDEKHSPLIRVREFGKRFPRSRSWPDAPQDLLRIEHLIERLSVRHVDECPPALPGRKRRKLGLLT
jgi:hypothetical protein